MRNLTIFFFSMLTLTLLGCSNGEVPVNGKATFQGKPIVYGTVVVVDSTGIPKAGSIKPDGSFTIASVKPGTVKIAVTSQAPPGANAGKAAKKVGRDADDDRTPEDSNATVNPEVAKNWFPLPQKYGYPDESGITMTVTSGQPLNIDLK